MMKVFCLLSMIAATSAASVSYDTGYDNGDRSLNSISCSDGANGLITKYGWSTQGQIPGYIGAAGAVSGWNSPNCGTCWKLTYGPKSIYVLAVDRAASDTFNIELDAMNALTNGQAVQLGRVNAAATQVAVSNCSL